jgi:hypothetical protein
MHIVQSLHAVVKTDAQRSWKERLLTWPWRPWRATKVRRKPAAFTIDEEALGIYGGRRYMLVHPSLVEQLRQQTEYQRQRQFVAEMFRRFKPKAHEQ